MMRYGDRELIRYELRMSFSFLGIFLLQWFGSHDDWGVGGKSLLHIFFTTSLWITHVSHAS